MKKYNFRNDYCSVGHEKILQAILEHSKNTYTGYGTDEETEEAIKLIRSELLNNEAEVFFLTGGTITNKVLISHVLKPYEAVISCDSGHINVHETGTIEQSGHKIIVVPGEKGKINPKDIINVCNTHTDEHMVKPKIVYISNPTEYGTVYNKQELTEISNVCKKYNLYLYVDGARLATALTSNYNDMNFPTFASLVDSFYIGGTKNGLILGEGLVVLNKSLANEMRYSIKHFGGMYSKGFVNGIQFKTLFTDNLFYQIGKKQNELAELLYNKLKELNVEFLFEQETNQIFPIFDNRVITKIENSISYEIWEKQKEKTIIRFVTHYNLTEEDIYGVVDLIKEAMYDL